MFLDRTIGVKDTVPPRRGFADMAEKTPREALVEEVLGATGLALLDTLAEIWPRRKKGERGVLKLVRCGVLGTCRLEAGGREFTACFAGKRVPEGDLAESLVAARFYVQAKLALPQLGLRPAKLFPLPAWELDWPGRKHPVYLVPVSSRTRALLPAAEKALVERGARAVFVVPEKAWRLDLGFRAYRFVLEEELFETSVLRLYLPEGQEDAAHPFRAASGTTEPVVAKK
ncbi:hypothetical protein Adeg_0685 [Ammonifex degensii KC4]|uniref:Uncharacterized protein n=1 Tax=Ammonifex degensii (strain DSM 10501 / KC4) TaxID=429009 RepID=C9RC55_AMMDK|nr:hypothetical protein [Ammonifex degensii]ACX51832.1 hypothetical protein Adeg_0685 [Ammonifex degensii KC4]